MKLLISGDLNELISKLAPECDITILSEKNIKGIKKLYSEADCIILSYDPSQGNPMSTLPYLKRLATEVPEIPVFVMDNKFSLSHHNEVTDYPNVIAYGQKEHTVTKNEFSNLIKDLKGKEAVKKRILSLSQDEVRKIGWSIQIVEGDFKDGYSDKLFLGEMRTFINNLKRIIDKIRPKEFLPDYAVNKPLLDWLEMWHAHKHGATHYADPNTGLQKPINRKELAEAKKLFEAEKINPSEQHILIRGETGAGKTFIAQFIHNYYYRTGKKGWVKEKPTIVSCPELQGNLAVPTLFGCLKGAWTDATTRVGYLLESYNGTLFLDEIGVASPHIQEKLLRYLDYQNFRPDGWSLQEGIYVPLLVVAASNQDIKRMIDDGKFRKDLFYRFMEIEIPPLRNCKEYFDIYIDCELQNPRTNNGYVDSIANEAIEILKNYSYPGNFREFHRILGLSVEKAKGMRVRTIIKEHVDSAMRQMGVTS